MNQFTSILFDLDGVIINTEPLHARAKRIAFEHYGVPVPDDMYAAFRGRSDKDMVEDVVQLLGPSSLEWKKVLAHKDEMFNALEHEIELISGAAEFIASARNHFDKLALVTSATKRNQEYALRRFELESFFDVIVTAEDITRDAWSHIRGLRWLRSRRNHHIVHRGRARPIQPAKHREQLR